MANVFTPIIPNVTVAFQRVAREKASLVALAQTDWKAEEVALNQAVTIPIAPTVAGGDRTPAAIFTVAADRTVTNTSITITKDRKFPFHLTGDDFLRMRQNPEFVAASIEQALRTARNEIHSDLAGLHVDAAGYYSASTSSSGAAAGTAGTTPFATTIDVVADLAKYLNDSLAPMDGRVLMIDTAAQAALQKLNQLVKANEAGSDALLRDGFLGRLGGFNVAWDNDVKSHTAGAGTGQLINGTPAVGATTIPFDTMTVNTTGIKAGDILTFAGDATRYVVATGSVATAGNIVLTSGLLAAPADNSAITIVATSRRSMAFHREALGLAIRLPALPKEGDAGEHQVITDPVTGVGFRFSAYKGYGLNNYELSAAWGVKTVRPELLKLLIG